MKTIFTFMLSLICMIGIAQDKIYVHTATTANINANYTVIDHPDLNGNPNAGIVYTHCWNPNNLSPVYNNNITGLWYNGANWTIYNEDLSPMVRGSHYMVYIANDPNLVITHISTAGNQGSYGGYTTVIDHAEFNNFNPGPYAVLSHYFNPNDVYNNQNFGFYYDTTKEKRGIYDQNADPAIPNGAAFKVLVNGQGVDRFTHTTTAANTTNHITTLDDFSINGNPEATFVFSHYWGMYGSSSRVSIDAVLSSYYYNGSWHIYSEDESTPMLEGLMFDIIIAPQDMTAGIGESEQQNLVVMYPNPTADILNFNASENIESVTIYNMLGQEVMNLNKSANISNIDVSNFTNGVYLVKVKTFVGEKTLQLIKE